MKKNSTDMKEALHSRHGPLSGVRVIDLTSIGMGPFATQMLGDMGADVVKIEWHPGDIFRQVTPQKNAGMSHAFLNLNRNKRSIELDLKSPSSRQVMRKLLVETDVFVSNVRPEALKRLGLDYASVSRINSRLIHCGCYGYGEGGPYSGRASVDDAIQAACGLAALQGYGKEAPCYVNSVVADKVCGLYVANAISMALFARTNTGRGQAIEVPMFECMVAFVVPEHLSGMTFVPQEGAAGYGRLLNPYRKPYRTSDDYIAVVPYTEAQWHRFFELIGREELKADPRYATSVGRSQHIAQLYALIEEEMLGRPSREWLALLARADIPCAPVNTVESLTVDPHLQATGFWHRLRHPTEGELLVPGIPIQFSDTPGSIRRLAPRLGEHTAEVLAECQD